MTMSITGDELERIRARDEAQERQERLHELDPHHVPLYVPADAEGFESEAYTAGWQQED